MPRELDWAHVAGSRPSTPIVRAMSWMWSTRSPAAAPGASASQVALNWIARKAGISSIIIGARSAVQLADNLTAATWSLSDAEIARLDEASAVAPRYPYAMHQNFGGDRNPAAPLLPPLPQS